MNIHPQNDYLFVSEDGDETSASGIVLAGTLPSAQARGVVDHVGPGMRDDLGNRIAMDVVPGDRIIFSRREAAEVEISGRRYLVLREASIMARLTGPAE